MAKRPNVVYVLTDDQGYGDLGCTGNPWIHTPNIDCFYDEALRMTNYHVGPTCAPTRSGIMTGHYANSTGVWHTIGGRSLLRDDEWTIATALKEGGYRTGLFGKWHLGDSHPYFPEDRGFDTVVSHGGGGISQVPDYWGNDYFDDTYRVNGEYKKFEGYCTDVFFREAKKFITECTDKDENFFCYIATNAPHAPYNVEKKYSDHYEGQVEPNRARFYGMIENIDENFGKLKEFLQEKGILDDTILIFMTDNGSSCSLSYNADGSIKEGYNAGFKGMKNSEYDGGHRVPFFISYPNGNIGGGKDNNSLCANVDFMPTILDYCGVSAQGHTFHGQSLRPTIEGNDEAFRERIVVTDSQRVPQPIKWRKSAAMKGEYRLVNGCELYNVAEDKHQDKDIASEHPEIVKELREGYEKWWKTVSVKFDDPIPLYLRKGNRLLTHDWRGDENNCLWTQAQIRQGIAKRGFWEVKVEEEGDYIIRFYRWAPETGYKLTQGIDGDDTGFSRENIRECWWPYYEGGNAIAIHKAHLIINGEIVDSVDVSDDDVYAEFKVHLTKDVKMLGGIFRTVTGGELGVYYGTVN